MKEQEIKKPGTENKESLVPPEVLTELKRRFPEQFAGTPEWQIRVRLEAAAKVYNETGLVIWE